MAHATTGTQDASRPQGQNDTLDAAEAEDGGCFAFAPVPPVVSQAEQQTFRSRNPFENTPHAAALEDTVLEGLCLTARAEIRHAMPLSTWIRTFVHGADPRVWTGIERERPMKCLCLSRMLERSLRSADYLGASADEQRMARSFVANTLREMERDLTQAQGRRSGFVDQILDIAAEKLGTDDEVLLTDIAKFMTAGRRFNLQLTNPHKKSRPGGSLMCMRVTAKWAMCRAVGAPFRHRDLNLEKTSQKHDAYRRAFNEARDAVNAGDHPDRAARLAAQRERLAEAERRFIAGWAAKFTDASGTRHEASIRVGCRSEPSDPQTYLGDHPLPIGTALLIRFNLMAKDGPLQASGHAIAVCGGDPPTFFDTNTGEYEYHGQALGKEVTAYVDALYRAKTPGASHVEWQIVALHRAGTGEAVASAT